MPRGARAQHRYNELKLRILRLLREQPNLTALEIAAKLGSHPSTIRSTLSKWSKFRRKYVHRRKGAHGYKYRISRYGEHILDLLEEQLGEGYDLSLEWRKPSELERRFM